MLYAETGNGVSPYEWNIIKRDVKQHTHIYNETKSITYDKVLLLSYPDIILRVYSEGYWGPSSVLRREVVHFLWRTRYKWRQHCQDNHLQIRGISLKICAKENTLKNVNLNHFIYLFLLNFQVDMRDIKVRFQQQYQKSLSSVLKADFPGDSKTLLLAMLGDNWRAGSDATLCDKDHRLLAIVYFFLFTFYAVVVFSHLLVLWYLETFSILRIEYVSLFWFLNCI